MLPVLSQYEAFVWDAGAVAGVVLSTDLAHVLPSPDTEDCRDIRHIQWPRCVCPNHNHLRCILWHTVSHAYCTHLVNTTTCTTRPSVSGTPSSLQQRVGLGLHCQLAHCVSVCVCPLSDSMVVFSGGVPIESLDSDSVTVTDSDDDTVTLLVTSSVRMMCIVEDQVTDMDSGMMDAGSDNESSVSVRKVLILLLEQEVLFVALQLPE